MSTSSGLPPLQTLLSGLVVAIVGFFSSFPIVLQGLSGMGASEAQAASGLMAASIAMGVTGILLSAWKREPISVAWSTPGIAFLAIAEPLPGGFSEAVAAFLLAGLLTVIAGLWKPLTRLAASIPAPLAQAMLGGILLPLCVAPLRALADDPVHALPIIVTWFVVGRFNRLFAVPAAVLAAMAILLSDAGFSWPEASNMVFSPVWTSPTWSFDALVGIGLPLFIITMATQNIPGIAILKTYGYEPAPGHLFTSVGGASIASAPLGAPATCLAAITAAMCANDDSYPDRSRRYWSAIFAGLFYCLFGLAAGAITLFAAMAPPMVLETLAGVALLGIFANATASALEPPESREAATITFLITISGINLLGLNAAVWGLLIGGGVHVLNSRRQHRH